MRRLTVGVARARRGRRGARPAGGGADRRRRRARARLRPRHRQPISARARSLVAVSPLPRRRPSLPTRGSAPTTAAGASCSAGRSRRNSWASVTPLPGIAAFPYSPVQVGTLQGAPAGRAPSSTVTRRSRRARVLAGTFVVDTATPRDGGPGVFLVPRCAEPGEPLPPAPPDAADDLAADAVATRPRPRVSARDPRLARHRQPRVAVLGRPAARRPRHRRPRRLRGRRRRPPGGVRLGVRRRHHVGRIVARETSRRRSGPRSAAGVTTVWRST